MNRRILSLVGSRVLAYLDLCRVKTARLQTESFGSAPDLLYIVAGRYPATQGGLEAPALAPSGLEGWNGPDVKGGRVSFDPWEHPGRCRSLADPAPSDELISPGADDRASGSGVPDRSDGER